MGRKAKLKKDETHKIEVLERQARRDETSRLVMECRREMADPLAVVSFRRLTPEEIEDRAEKKRVEARENEIKRLAEGLSNE